MIFCETQKVVKTSWNISEMFIVFWPITTKIRTCMQATKPQTKLRLLFDVWFSYPWLTFSSQHNNIPEIFVVFTVFRVLQKSPKGYVFNFKYTVP